MCSYLLEHTTSPPPPHHPPSLGYFPPAFFFRMCCLLSLSFTHPRFPTTPAPPLASREISYFHFSPSLPLLHSIKSPLNILLSSPLVSEDACLSCGWATSGPTSNKPHITYGMVWYGMVRSCGSATTAPTSNKPHITTWASGPRYEVEDEEDRWYNQLKKKQHFVLRSWCFNSRTLLHPFLPPVDVFQTTRFR